MREISYHKDYRHNYLIIREDEMTGDDYQRKMITENRIRGLLENYQDLYDAAQEG